MLPFISTYRSAVVYCTTTTVGSEEGVTFKVSRFPLRFSLFLGALSISVIRGKEGGFPNLVSQKGPFH